TCPAEQAPGEKCGRRADEKGHVDDGGQRIGRPKNVVTGFRRHQQGEKEGDFTPRRKLLPAGLDLLRTGNDARPAHSHWNHAHAAYAGTILGGVRRPTQPERAERTPREVRARVESERKAAPKPTVDLHEDGLARPFIEAILDHRRSLPIDRPKESDGTLQ